MAVSYARMASREARCMLPYQRSSFTWPWPREPWDRLDTMSKMCCAVLLLMASLGKPCSKQVAWRTHMTIPIRPCTAAALLCGFLRSSTLPFACLAFALPLEHGVKAHVATSTAITVSQIGDEELQILYMSYHLSLPALYDLLLPAANVILSTYT